MGRSKDTLGIEKYSSEEEEIEGLDFEQALSVTGFGKFHYCFILICGAIFFSAGIQSGLSGYVMSSAKCDLKMSANEMGLLTAIFLAGSTSSSFFWGILADQLGRKVVLVYSLLLDGILTFLSSFAPTFEIFAIFRFINGFLVGAPGILVFPYLGEFVGEKQRDMCLVTVGFFWAISWVMLPAVAWGVIPMTWSVNLYIIDYNSWRLYVQLAAIPMVLTAFVLWRFFSESPKFLYSQGREIESLEILGDIYKTNFGKKTFPIKRIKPSESENVRKNTNINNNEIEKESRSNSQILYSSWLQFKSLFEAKLCGRTVLGCLLQFTNLFSYFGLGLWLPEIFNRFEEHYSSSDISVTVCELSRLRVELQKNMTLMYNDSNTPIIDTYCSADGVKPSVFINALIIGCSYLVGNVIQAFLARKIKLKILAIITNLISGVCAGAIYFLRTSTQNLIVSCLFLSFVGCSNTVLCSVVSELFPTKVRAIALCLAIFAGRMAAVLSNLTIGYILDLNCEIPVFLMSAALICCGFLCILLPQNNKNVAV